MKVRLRWDVLPLFLVALAAVTFSRGRGGGGGSGGSFDGLINQNAARMMQQGRQTFRFDTFGDEAFWGDTLQLHKAIAGGKLGGVGPGVSPNAALALGLKVDLAALPDELVKKLQQGQ